MKSADLNHFIHIFGIMVAYFLCTDGKSIWQPSRDAGVPENFPADPGGED